MAGRILYLRGDPASAVPYFERALAVSMEINDTGYRPEIERVLAEALLQLGDVDRAEAHAESGVAVVAADDKASLASTSMVLGKVRARQGRHTEAEPLFRKAV